jgi:hypothetical protein
MRELEAFGSPSILIVPNGWHRLDAHAFKERYPSLRVYCPASQRKRVEKEVSVDGVVEEMPGDDCVRGEVLDGSTKRAFSP